MASNKDPIFLNSLQATPVQILNADASTEKTVFTAGAAEGGLLTVLSATTDDTTAVDLVVKLKSGATTNILGIVNIPIGSGTDGTTDAVNILIGSEISYKQDDDSIPVGKGDSIVVNALATVTSGKTVYVTAAGGSYDV